MTRILRLLLIAAIALPLWQPMAAQDAEKQAELEKARIAAETGQPLEIRVPRAPKTSRQASIPSALLNVNRTTMTKTVCDGTRTSEYAPVYGYYFDYGTTTLMVYPKETLGLSPGDKITGLKFYSSSNPIDNVIGNATVTVRVGNTSDTEVEQSLDEIEAFREEDQEITVYEGQLAISGNEMTVTFSQDFIYDGRNLVVDFQTAASGSYKSVSWYGVNTSYASFVCVFGTGSSVATGATTSFLPKMEITYDHVDVDYYAGLTGNGAFGVIQKGTSANKTFRVINYGTRPFTPHLDSDNAAFTITGDMNTQIASGESREFTVTFTAATATEYTGTLTLSAPESNDINGTATLKGEGSIAATVADGSATNSYVPVWGQWYDSDATHHQMIYPESMLTNVAGKKIKSITFYPTSSIRFGGGELTVTMGTTTESAFSSAAFQTISGTTVSKDITPTVGDQVMHIEFDTPFEYTSDNLIIDTKVKTAATYGSTSWYGINTDNNQSIYGRTSNNLLTFLPKITFEFEEAVTVDKTELIFGDVAVGTASAAQTVTVGNSTGSDVDLSWTFSNNVFSTTATANTVQAGSVVEIPVVLTPTAIGSQTGTLTINAGGETFTVALSGNGLMAYAATVDPQTIDFGHVAVDGNATATVTITNTGMNDFTPTFTDPTAPFSVTGVEGKLDNGESITYTVTFAPEETGNFTGSFTIQDPANSDINYTVTLSGVGVELDPITANPSTLDFGTVNKGATKDLTVTFTNPNSEAVTVTLNVPAAYSVDPTSFTLAANGSQTVTVTFAPTAAASYNGTLTANAAGLNIDVVLKGVGRVEGSPEAVRDEAFFAGIEYKWPISTEANTSTLDEIATDPDQIIAMLRKVYMDRTIPGNYKRGYSETGGSDHDDDVMYTGVGKIASSTAEECDDSYGWSIPGTVLSGTSGSYSYRYMKEDQYKPYDEGVTLLLLEINDNFDVTKVNTNGDPTHDYNKLRDYVSESIKSARVITEAKRVGDKSDFSSGTLFKINCDKMNKFFLIAKGQLGWLQQRRNNLSSADASSSDYYSFYSYPMYYNDTYLDIGLHGNYFDVEPAFLCHMFEQFSPAEGSASSTPLSDGYQMFVTEMKSFGIEHDCPNVPFVYGTGHHFMMYGADSQSADCQDIRDMMFFVPDYRMMNWTGRGSKSSTSTSTTNRRQDYFNYNTSHQPSIGVFVIQQDEIPEGTIVSSNQTTMTGLYKHQLSWTSNLDKYLPGEEQEYELWEVVVDEFGVESYVPVYYRNAQGQYTDAEGTAVSRPVPIVLDRVDMSEFSYTSVYVDMKAGSQTKTYVIRGRDKEHFMSLQMSNQQEIFIPGLDPNEKAHMIGATYYSRYNPKNEMNCYSNRLELSNNGMTLTADDLSKPMKFYRLSRAAKLDANDNVITDANGNIQYADEVEKTLIATATASGNNLNVELSNQSDEDDYPDGVTSGNAAGYHANSSLSFPYTIRNGVVQFNNNRHLQFWDNFTVDVSKNAHPLQYLYKMEVEGAGLATVTLNAAACSQGNEVWYAWTWPDGGDGEWVAGISKGDNVYEYAGIPANNKINFVRMNPNATGIPRWNNNDNDNAVWNQTPNNYASIDGSTFTLKGYWDDGFNIWGEWTGDKNGNAYSNDVRVPVYKTDSRINGSFTKDQVDADDGVNLTIPEDVEFEAKVQLSSKTEILRYDAYRWSTKEIQDLAVKNSHGISIIDEVDGDDEEDVDPTGIAGNQGDWYTVSMNKVNTTYYYAASEADQPEVSTDQPNNWANFIDHYPKAPQVEDAYEYLYAPVVELFTKGYKQGSTTDKRKDYNSYGGPQSMTAVGKLEVEQLTGVPPMSRYFWTETVNDEEKRFAYYDIQLNVPTKEIPSGYSIYKVRVWRQILDDNGNPAPQLLKEEYATQIPDIAARMGDANGRFMFEIDYEDDDAMYAFEHDSPLGSDEIEEDVVGVNGNTNHITYTLGTFGAQKVRTEGDDEQGVIEQLNLKFQVRMYFTRSANLTGSKGIPEGKDDKFYVVEEVIPVTVKGDTPITGIDTMITSREAISVKYYNVAGVESDTPFQGVNIVVTRYSDGSKTTTKILK